MENSLLPILAAVTALIPLLDEHHTNITVHSVKSDSPEYSQLHKGLLIVGFVPIVYSNGSTRAMDYHWQIAKNYEHFEGTFIDSIKVLTVFFG